MDISGEKTEETHNDQWSWKFLSYLKLGLVILYLSKNIFNYPPHTSPFNIFQCSLGPNSQLEPSKQVWTFTLLEMSSIAQMLFLSLKTKRYAHGRHAMYKEILYSALVLQFYL